ncbi:hypothetical protein FRC08_012723 [Ceratobasidium sp. 394]|nr:hypothetical protein FRC08_012723 [Ceratobasidium sp. 394]
MSVSHKLTKIHPRLRAPNLKLHRGLHTSKTMKVAITGCCHGELDATYQQIQDLEQRNNYKVDLVLINGDFQAIRNHQDLLCMASPDKHKKLGTFYKYYTGEVKAPVLTLVIGGNHEASNYMWELYHGGWLAPNIYYLGGSGCVKFGGLRIAGASGIHKGYNYRLGHHERLPYNQSDLRSAYHTRLYDVMKSKQLSSPDIFMSHDWPVEITQYGDQKNLLEQQPRFRPSIEKGEFGSPPMMELLWSLQPAYWFSAHMHCKFEAVVNHEPPDSTSAATPGQAAAGPSEGAKGPTLGNEQPLPSRRTTRFLALDKCVPNRPYMQLSDITPSTPPAPSASPPTLTFDREWLAISRALHPFLSTTRRQQNLPPPQKMARLITESQLWVDENVGEREIISVQKFAMTAPGPVNRDPKVPAGLQPPPWYRNAQTEAFCAMLGLENKTNPPTT